MQTLRLPSLKVHAFDKERRFPYWTNGDGTQRKKTVLKPNQEVQDRTIFRTRKVIEMWKDKRKSSIPHPPRKNVSLPFPTTHLTKMRKNWKLKFKQNIFQLVPMCVFNPFHHPFKRMVAMLAHSNPKPRSFGFKSKP